MRVLPDVEHGPDCAELRRKRGRGLVTAALAKGFGHNGIDFPRQRSVDRARYAGAGDGSAAGQHLEKNDAERVIRQLFEFWMTKPENLPQSYQEKAEQEPLARIVCDYIAGMTDNFIYEQHEKYVGSS